MFRQLDYQDRVLTAIDAHLDLLKEEKVRSDQIAALAQENPGLGLSVPDFAQQAWENLKATGNLPASRAAIPFSPRRDGCNRPVPNAVLKVPTGGGKTWLAIHAVSRIMGRYLNRNTGSVLWIVPNEAIYTQTLKNLKDRQHPYRQALDRAAAGRVRIMEKTDPLNARDVETNLCVMLLMLQSSNRQNRESLKMFQDRGDVHGFFPPEGEQQAHKAALDQTPNLDGYNDIFPMVKDSLGNALRIIRPVVVLDEGHRAISDLAFRTLYGFNPCFVLELTATPQDVPPRGGRNPRAGRYANVLVEVTGRDLDREGMIKMPLNLDPRQGNDSEVPGLDECHVITHRTDTAKVVEAIKNGLENDGLGDMVLQVSQDDPSGGGGVARKIERRPAFASTEIYLPKVMVVDGAEARDLDYEADVLSCIDWRGYDPKDLSARIPDNAAESQLQRIKLSDDGDELFVGETVAENAETLALDPAHAVRMISDMVPNPFVGWEIVDKLLSALKARGFDEAKLGGLASLIAGELRKGLDTERTVRAEALFKEEVKGGRIQFRLRLDGRNWRMPFVTETMEPENARQLVSTTGGPLEKSLFAPMYENELNQDERDVAIYLDSEDALSWWHRNVARTQYGIQAWKKAKIYPDFIFAVRGKGVTVLETKGDHLDNLDTAYKREVLSFLSDNFGWNDCTPAGELELIQSNGETVQGTLILMSEWRTKLPEYLRRGDQDA